MWSEKYGKQVKNRSTTKLDFYDKKENTYKTKILEKITTYQYIVKGERYKHYENEQYSWQVQLNNVLEVGLLQVELNGDHH